MDDSLMSELVRRLQEAAQLSNSSSGGSSPRGSEHEVARRCLFPDGLSALSSLAPPSRGSSGWRGSPARSSCGGASPTLPPAAGASPGAAGAGASTAGARLWRDLPADVMSLVVQHLALPEVKASRLVCRAWHLSISSHVLLLRPRSLRAEAVAARFPSLQAIELKQCRTLQDWEVEPLAAITSLVSVSLEGCENITDDAMPTLARLPRLRHLSLRNTVKVTDVGLRILTGARGQELPSPLWGSPLATVRLSPVAQLRASLLRSPSAAAAQAGPAPALPPQPPAPALESLDVSGCVMLTERGFAALAAALHASLTSLAIGGTSRVSTVTDAVLAEVAALTRLRRLDLSGCTQIGDAGLAHLTALTHLRSLSLWNCLRLTDAGLTALAGAGALTDLCLRGCQQLSDAALVHLAALTSLQRLDARACEHLRGEELSRLARLPLTELSLRGCYAVGDSGVELGIAALRSLHTLVLQEVWQITGAGLAHLSGLTRLQCLDLQGCRNLANPAGQPLPGLAALAPSLTSLSLRNCDRLADGALAALAAASRLVSLDLSGCRELSASALAPVAGLPALASLRLQHCAGLRGPAALAPLARGCASLTSLHLGGSENVYGQALRALRAQTALCSLSLEGSRVVILDEGLKGLAPALGLLTALCLQGCSTLTDAGLAALGALTSLATLNASDCGAFTGAGFGAWGPMPALTRLELQNSAALGDDGLALAAQRCPQLRALNLKHCRQLGDTGLAAAAPALPHLSSLCLQGMTGLTNEGLACLAGATALRELELQFCWWLRDAGVQHLTALELTRLDLMYAWQVTDQALAALEPMTSLLSLNVLGNHRLSGSAKARWGDRLEQPHTF